MATESAGSVGYQETIDAIDEIVKKIEDLRSKLWVAEREGRQ